jgi:ankyrin repeat protein
MSEVLDALYQGRREEAERLATEPDVLEAAALGRLDVLRTHLDGDQDALAARTPDGFTPLHLAAFFGGGPAVRLLLAAGAPPDADAANDLAVHPLHSATASGDHDAVRALLEAGANPNLAQRGGYTPLLQAAHADDPEMTELLLSHGADRTAVAEDGRDVRAMAGPRVTPLVA